MPITASAILIRLSTTLNDLDAVRWPEAEMLRAIDDAVKMTLEAKPDWFEYTATALELVAGPRQTAPSDCYLIFDVIYNTDDQGVPLSGITKVDRTMMDRVRRGWMADNADSQVEHWMQDAEERLNFWVYPPQPGVDDPGPRGYVNLRYAKMPTAVVNNQSVIAVSVEAINALYYAGMFRLLEKDEKFAGSPQSQSYLQKFAMVTEAREVAEAEHNQERTAREGS